MSRSGYGDDGWIILFFGMIIAFIAGFVAWAVTSDISTDTCAVRLSNNSTMSYEVTYFNIDSGVLELENTNTDEYWSLAQGEWTDYLCK